MNNKCKSWVWFYTIRQSNKLYCDLCIKRIKVMGFVVLAEPQNPWGGI